MVNEAISTLNPTLHSAQVNASRCFWEWVATSAALTFQASTQTTSTATGASLYHTDTVSNFTSPSWTWKSATVCQASATTTQWRSSTVTARQTTCWDAGVAGSNLPLLFRREISCWWCSAQTEMKLAEGSLLLILVVSVLHMPVGWTTEYTPLTEC